MNTKENIHCMNDKWQSLYLDSFVGHMRNYLLFSKVFRNLLPVMISILLWLPFTVVDNLDYHTNN